MEPPPSSTSSSQISAPIPVEQPPQSQPQQQQPQSQQQQSQSQQQQLLQYQQQQPQYQQQQPQYQQQQQQPQYQQQQQQQPQYQQQQQQAQSQQLPPQQSQPQPPPQQQQQQPTSSSSIQNPNPNPTNSQSFYPQQLNIRGTPFNRPWSQPTSQFSHFPSQFHSSSTTTTATTSSVPQRGGIAIGVPAASQPAASFAAQYPSSVSSSSPSPARPPMHGMPGMGMIGSQVRPGGVPSSALHQQRPVQAASGIRPQTTPNSLASAPQNFQGHGMLRASSVTSPSTSTPSTSQSQQSPNQPWLRPPLPSQSYRPQVNPQSLQQRSHIPQQSPQTVQATPPQPNQLLPSPQQQQHIPASNQSQENYGNQLASSRASQPLLNQQHSVRVQGSANLRPLSPVTGQASTVHSGPTDNTSAAEFSEPCSTILSKRSIQELVTQIDPYEKLDPEVEDVLVDIAEDFIDSVTTFGCSLAKHRKSSTLEAKDILLPLDRTWNMTLPGFNGDEIKTYKKPVINDIHKERLSLIKKSLTGAESKTSSGPATGNVKGHLAKATPNVVGS